jgi:hypothetical protein
MLDDSSHLLVSGYLVRLFPELVFLGVVSVDMLPRFLGSLNILCCCYP